ncbi:MAG: hypothetical protein GDA65_12610 [Nitrospira sp. CR1.1]|jgi:hypothetical protein|nr:hypothetical protein [Nitrospira sp. CR1.1]
MEAPGNKQAHDTSDLSGFHIEQTTLNGIVMNTSTIITTGNDGAKMGGFISLTKEGIPARIDAFAVEQGQKARVKMGQITITGSKQPAGPFQNSHGYKKLDIGGTDLRASRATRQYPACQGRPKVLPPGHL